MLGEPLPCELGAGSGDEISEDQYHWFINQLVWGPYQDALGQEVFLASVSGVDYLGKRLTEYCFLTAAARHSAKAYPQISGEPESHS